MELWVSAIFNIRKTETCFYKCWGDMAESRELNSEGEHMKEDHTSCFKKFKENRGLSTIELLVVIAILALLAQIASELYTDYRRRHTMLRQLTTANNL